MATTNDQAVINLGRLKTYDGLLKAEVAKDVSGLQKQVDSVNAATKPLPGESNYEKAIAETLSCAIGNGSMALGDSAIAIGSNSRASDFDTIAIGKDSEAIGISSIAIGETSIVDGGGSIAIGVGSRIRQADLHSVALGTSSTTTKSNQVSIGNNASHITRYLSNVKDPVDDQDAATRHWTKNADRSDVFATNYDNNVAGGTGRLYLEANADLNWFAVRGYVLWNSFSTAWGNMVRLPGTSEGWWIKTALKVPTVMIPQTNFMAYCSAVDFLGDHSVPYSPNDIAIGTDGYIYIGPWYESHGSTPLGILCLGHRFYL